jgi:uncharacterized protein DUF5919
MPRFARTARVLPYAAFVSVIVFLLGVILLLMSYQVRPQVGSPTLPSEILRDLGIVLCSIGLISLLYELLIRGQLIADYNNSLQEILDPDTKKLGVRALFRDRDDKTTRGRSLDAMLRATRKEMFCLGLGFYQFLPEKRDLLLAKIREGCSFKFLIFDAKSRNAKALDESLGYGNGSLIRFLEAQQAYFADFMKLLADEGLGDRFELRTYDPVPTFGALAVDPSAPDGFLIVELYGCGVEGAVCPGMELVPKGSYWHAFYDRQLNELWRGAQPLPTGSARLADASNPSSAASNA